jgi:hypothetical protein
MPRRRRRSLHPPWQAESGKTAGVEAVQGLSQRLALAGHVEWRGGVRRRPSPGQDSQKSAAAAKWPMQATFGPPSSVCLYKSAMHPHLVLDPAVPGNNTHSNPTSSSLYHFTHCIPDQDQGHRSIGKHRLYKRLIIPTFCAFCSFHPTYYQHTTNTTSKLPESAFALE